MILDKYMPLVVRIALTATIIAIIAFTFYPVLPIPTGSVTGELVSFKIKPIDYDLMIYPYTKVVLNNYTTTGDISEYDNTFWFDGEYPDVEDLTIGNTYEFVYKKGSRPSDTTSGDDITQFYLLWINEVET